MKKLALGLTACALSVLLLGCGASQSAVAGHLDSKMNDLQKTITSIGHLSSSDIALDEQNNTQNTAVQTAGYGAPYGNLNTYAFPTFGYGMYPMGMYGYGSPMQYGGMFGMGAYNPYGYMNNGYGMGYGVGFNGANNAGRYVSNIDTYRINSVRQDGKTVTTIDSFHNGEHTGQEVITEENEDMQTEDGPEINAQSFLENTCGICLSSNNYGNALKSEILSNIQEVKTLSGQIKNATLELSKGQVESVNELLDNISATQSKINMSKGEFHRQAQNVKTNKHDYLNAPTQVNTKYVRLLGCMDTRNAYLQNILNSLIQMENCIGGNCLGGFQWKGANTNQSWLNNCPHGECAECTNCPTCATCNKCSNCQNSSGLIECSSCNNCLLCTDCTNCNNCFNCSNCINCSNLANVSNYKDNKPCPDCQPSNNQNQRDDKSNQPATNLRENPNIMPSLQLPSTDSVRVPNHNSNTNNQQTSNTNSQTDADKTVENNLVEPDNQPSNTKILPASDNNSQNSTNSNNHANPQPNNNQTKTDTNSQSVVNQNEHENNKGLTA